MFEMEDSRLIDSSFRREDIPEVSLRPKSLSEYIGQDQVVNQLKIFIEAAKQRQESLDHVLLYGPPGLGKTTLSHIIAEEMRVDIKVTSGPAIERAGDLASILTNLKENDVLFIDEIHRIHRTVEEVLYPALEDYCLDIIIGKGPSARSIRLDIPRFTLIGATTRTGMLTSPLRDRFGVILNLELYQVKELLQIITRSAGILQVPITEEGAVEIARRSRGTPRIANRLLRRIRDYAQVIGDGHIDLKITKEALAIFGVDEEGLDKVDQRLMRTIIEKFSGGPVGLDTIAAAIGEDKDSIEEVCEPFLIQKGFIHRTPRGRVATEAAFRHFGIM